MTVDRDTVVGARRTRRTITLHVDVTEAVYLRLVRRQATTGHTIAAIVKDAIVAELRKGKG